METTATSVGKTKLDELKFTSDQLDRVLEEYGFELKRPPISTNFWSQMATRSLDPLKVKYAAAEIQRFACVLTEILSDGIDLRDSKTFTRNFLNRLSLRCDQVFLDTIGSDDLVEAYNIDHIQIFRNMRFMEFSGYSLTEILTNDWATLYERSQVVTTQLFECVQKVLTSKCMHQMPGGAHLMKEKFSSTRQVNEIKFKYMAPLWDGNNNLAGYIANCTANLLDSRPERHELRFI